MSSLILEENEDNLNNFIKRLFNSFKKTIFPISFITILVISTIYLNFQNKKTKEIVHSEAVESNLTSAVSPQISPLWGYDSHPNFWPAGGARWTAKKYTHASDSASKPGQLYNIEWVWSGPFQNDPNFRYIIYQPYPNGAPGSYREWEKWLGNPQTHEAINYSFGGVNESSAGQMFKDISSCYQNQGGFIWPELNSTTLSQFVSISSKNSKGCSRQWYSGKRTGGYMSIKLKETWDLPNSDVRKRKCNEKIPSTMSPIGNAICYNAPNVGVVSQRYGGGETIGSDQKTIVDGTIQYGCEMTVYAWGYPQDSSNNYQNWFRNGELRWSYYRGLNSSGSPYSPNDSWWDNNCNDQTWTIVPNMLYTGTYKLTNNELTDTGK